jgi:hypothetical protein
VNPGEAEKQLPNGLHDADLVRYSVDYETRTAEFVFDAWTGDMQAPAGKERERHERIILRVKGLYFIAIDPPDARPEYRDRKDCLPEVLGFSAWNGKPHIAENIEALAASLPQGLFCESGFVRNWNAFMHIAGESAEIEYLK